MLVAAETATTTESHSALLALVDTTHPHFWEAWVAVGTPLLALVTLLLFGATWLLHRDSKKERAERVRLERSTRLEARREARVLIHASRVSTGKRGGPRGHKSNRRVLVL